MGIVIKWTYIRNMVWLVHKCLITPFNIKELYIDHNHDTKLDLHTGAVAIRKVLD